MDLSPLTLLTTVLLGLLFFGARVAVLIAALVRWRENRPLLPRALRLTAVVFLLGLPGLGTNLIYLDLGATTPELPPGAAPLVLFVTRASILVGAVVGFLLLNLEVVVAIRARPQHHPFPALFGAEGRMRGVVVGLVLGGVSGLGSLVLFRALGVQEGDLVQVAQKMQPGLDHQSPVYLLGVFLPLALSLAISEEVFFRGVLQRYLERWLGGAVVATAAAIVITSLLWALAHLGNTDQAGIKLAQIFVLGLAFGVLAKRTSVEASIAAHVALNATAIVADVLL